MEDLKTLWEEQAAYNKLVKEQVQNQDWTGTLVLGLMEEGTELLEAVGWKKHRKPVAVGGGAVAFDKVAATEQLADIAKYLISLCQHLDVSQEDLLAAIALKNEAMQQRLMQEFAPPLPGRRVLISDLDGTLADFTSTILELVGEKVSETSSTAIDVSVGMAYPAYWTMRRQWEKSGGYRRLKPYSDGIELVRRAKQDGVYLIVMTARPKDIKRVWLDSLAWLLDYGIHPDRLILGDNERVLLAEELVKSGFPVVMLEDDPVLAQRAATVCPVLVRTQSYNKDITGSNIYHTARFNPVDLTALWWH